MSKLLDVDGTHISIREAKRRGAYIVYWVTPLSPDEYPSYKRHGWTVWSTFKQLRTFERAITYARSLKGGETTTPPLITGVRFASIGT